MEAIIEIETSRPAVRIEGDLDAGTIAAFRGSVVNAAESGDVTLDLRDLGFSDSAGLNALVRTHYDFARSGRRLILTNVPSRLFRLLELAGLDEVLCTDE